MNENVKKGLVQVLTAIAEMYGKTVSAVTMEMWVRLLEPYRPDEIRRALEDHCRESQWMPKPADIINRINGKDDVSTEELHSCAVIAWQRATNKPSLYAGAAWKDPCIAPAIQSLGGWSFICHMTAEQEPFARRDFIDAYQVYARKYRDQGGFENVALGGLHSVPLLENATETGTHAGKMLPARTINKLLDANDDLLLGTGDLDDSPVDTDPQRAERAGGPRVHPDLMAAARKHLKGGDA